MNNGFSSPGPNAWQGPNNGAPPQAQGYAFPGPLPPPIANQPGNAQSKSSTSQRPGKPDNTSSSRPQDAPFPELGRAGSVLGWMLDYVSPRTSNAQDTLSADVAAGRNLLVKR